MFYSNFCRVFAVAHNIWVRNAEFSQTLHFRDSDTENLFIRKTGGKRLKIQQNFSYGPEKGSASSKFQQAKSNFVLFLWQVLQTSSAKKVIK